MFFSDRVITASTNSKKSVQIGIGIMYTFSTCGYMSHLFYL